MFLAAKVKFCEQKLNNAENEEFRDKRRIPLPNRMIFWKNSKQPLTRPPLLIFEKVCCKFFIRDMVAFTQGGKGQIVSVNIS